MPRGDGTGPRGEGTMTGRGAGYCAGTEQPGYINPPFNGPYGQGRGAGGPPLRGRGRGFGWGFER
ncbi:MAG: DUF5320 domain-containing protein [Candidatus Aenigmarchaeota archaeon]|nr:DUF5320 domain-containing protein [Candidatus Aenigmarchaeota archaeon]